MSRSNSILKHLATLGPIGYLPLAPGTWGSLAAAVAVFFLPITASALLVAIAACTVIGIAASDVAERIIGDKDSGHIVIDEFVGMMISVVFLPRTAGYVAAAFCLFRLFDILKPFPIRLIESSLKGGPGIMADDVAAGIAANLVLQAWKTIS